MRVNGYTITRWSNVAINCLELIFSLKTLIQQSALNCGPENTWREGLLPHSFSVYPVLALSGLGSRPRAWPFCCQFMRRLCFQSYLGSNLKPNPGSKNDRTSWSLTEISGSARPCGGCACLASRQVEHSRSTELARWWLLIKLLSLCVMHSFWNVLTKNVENLLYRLYRGIPLRRELQSLIANQWAKLIYGHIRQDFCINMIKYLDFSGINKHSVEFPENVVYQYRNIKLHMAR